MELGLASLSDDQIICLLSETLSDITRRDVLVYTAAQEAIYDESDRRRTLFMLLAKATKSIRTEYLRKLRSDVMESLREGIRSGTVRVLTPSEDADAVASVQNPMVYLVIRQDTSGALRFSQLHRNVNCVNLRMYQARNISAVDLSDISGPLFQQLGNCRKCWEVVDEDTIRPRPPRSRRHRRRNRRRHRRNP